MRGPIPVLVATAVVLAVAIGVVVALIIGTAGPVNQAADQITGPTGTSRATTAPTPPTGASTTTPATTSRVSGPVCDARVINRDLGYPDSGARLIDCEAGWAVMGAEISGDPFWVAYRNGRWRSVDDVSIYRLTCPEEAIAKGAPARLARKHLNCQTVDRAAPTSSRSSRTARSSRMSTPSRSSTPSRTPAPSASSSPQTSSATSSTATTTSGTTDSTPGGTAEE